MSAAPSHGGPAAFGGLPADAWDALAGPHFYSSAGWLGFCATDYGGPSAAAVVSRGGSPAVAVPYAPATGTLLEPYHWHQVLAGHGLPAPPPGGLLVGPREGYQTHLLGAGGPGEVAALVAQLRAAAGPGQPCVAMYLGSHDALALHRTGLVPTPVLLEADPWIELPAGGWPEWLTGLSRHRRATVRAEVRRFAEAGFRVEHAPLAESVDQLGDMACATLAKYGHETAPAEAVAVLRNHASCMGDAARTALLRTRDGTLAGFALYYLWQDTVFLRWAGLDYGLLAGAAEYFNLCYYALIELAGRHGLRRLHPGLRSIEAKALRGARLRPLWLVDLTAGSVLAPAADQIRRHNARMHAQLLADPRTASAATDPAWELFR